MDPKVALLLLVLVALVSWTDADFNYNRNSPKLEELAKLGFACIPGHTYIKVETLKQDYDDDDEDDDEDTRRTHMNSIPSGRESCLVCMCSVNGKDEFCTRRPAMNVNECIRMGSLMKTFKRNKPFDHERSLSQRIRRDLIWHYNEIPYDPDARCVRGQTFYTNKRAGSLVKVNITWHEKVENLLDYESTVEDDDLSSTPEPRFDMDLFERPGSRLDGLPGRNATNGRDGTGRNNCDDKNGTKGDDKDDLNSWNAKCFYCICSVHGYDMSCIPRDVYFCDYYKALRHPEAVDTLVGTNDTSHMTQIYKKQFKSPNMHQPYFRHISYRIRRTMDDGIFDFIDSGGDALCCDHPDGHRRTLHNIVKNRIRNIRRRVPKENLMSKGPGEDYVDFVVNNDK